MSVADRARMRALEELQQIKSDAFADMTKFEQRQGGRVSDVGVVRRLQGTKVYEKSIKQKQRDAIVKDIELHKFDATATAEGFAMK